MTTDVFDLAGKRVFVAGHRGMVGSALVRRLAQEQCTVLTASRAQADLRDQAAVFGWFAQERPEVVVLAAAKVGGILANDTYPADFLYDNLMIEANVIEAARLHGTAKLLFLGSSCIYPKFADQPIAEEALLTGPLEPTNEWYAVAKIAGIKLCQAYRRQHGCDFISVMPPNLYGPGDNYDLVSSHVLPALIRKAHEANGRRQRHHHLGHGNAPARIPARRRSGRRLRVSAESLFRCHADQCRRGRGHSHRCACRAGLRDRRVCWRCRARYDQAGRHTAQAARRTPDGRAGLVPAHPAARRNCGGLLFVFENRGMIAMARAIDESGGNRVKQKALAPIYPELGAGGFTDLPPARSLNLM